MRKGKTSDDLLLMVYNLTPVMRHNYRVGVPRGGTWKEVLNSDAKSYGGSGQGNFGAVETSPIRAHGKEDSIALTLPPLGVVFLKSEGMPLSR